MIDFVKKINVKDAVYMTAGAWDDIPSLTLSKSWLKLLGTGHRITETSDDNAEEQTCEELAKQLDNNLSDSDTNGEAMEMLDKCLAWYECQSDATPTSIMLLKRIRDLAAKQRYASLKQLTLQSCLATCK